MLDLCVELTMKNRSEPKQGEKITVHVDAELKEIMPGFLDGLRDDVNSIRQALRNNDYMAIREMGHRLKGVGGTCGFDAVSEIGGEIEKAAKGMHPGEIREALEMFASYLDQVEVVYE